MQADSPTEPVDLETDEWPRCVARAHARGRSSVSEARHLSVPRMPVLSATLRASSDRRTLQGCDRGRTATSSGPLRSWRSATMRRTEAIDLRRIVSKTTSRSIAPRTIARSTSTAKPSSRRLPVPSTTSSNATSSRRPHVRSLGAPVPRDAGRPEGLDEAHAWVRLPGRSRRLRGPAVRSERPSRARQSDLSRRSVVTVKRRLRSRREVRSSSIADLSSHSASTSSCRSSPGSSRIIGGSTKASGGERRGIGGLRLSIRAQRRIVEIDAGGSSSCRRRPARLRRSVAGSRPALILSPDEPPTKRLPRAPRRARRRARDAGGGRLREHRQSTSARGSGSPAVVAPQPLAPGAPEIPIRRAEEEIELPSGRSGSAFWTVKTAVAGT